jgi:hypothetical protein
MVHFSDGGELLGMLWQFASQSYLLAQINSCLLHVSLLVEVHMERDGGCMIVYIG